MNSGSLDLLLSVLLLCHAKQAPKLPCLLNRFAKIFQPSYLDSKESLQPSVVGFSMLSLLLLFHAKYFLFSCLYLLHSLKAARTICMDAGRKKGCADSRIIYENSKCYHLALLRRLLWLLRLWWANISIISHILFYLV